MSSIDTPAQLCSASPASAVAVHTSVLSIRARARPFLSCNVALESIPESILARAATAKEKNVRPTALLARVDGETGAADSYTPQHDVMRGTPICVVVLTAQWL